MSGFGLRSLKKQNNEAQEAAKVRYVKNIVMGENPYAYLTYKKFESDVLFVTQNPYGKEQIERDLACTINAVRSSEVADEISFENVEVKEPTNTVLFYKDTKFQKFGGRAKPHDLAEGEDFFIKPYQPIQMPVIEEDETLAQNQVHKIIQKIKLVEPTDLVEPTHFELYTGENEIFKCEKLYFCESPRSFYSLVENKEKLDEKLQKFLVGVENHPGITVHFECEGRFTDHVGSILIPQSLTHDWGNFILDIEEFDGTHQNFKALTFVSDDDLQEEDLAKKIRHLRKVIERVLPDLEQCEYTTTIKYDHALRMTGINDGLAADLRSYNVRFVGPGAPIMHPQSELFQYFARGSMSLSQL